MTALIVPIILMVGYVAVVAMRDKVAIAVFVVFALVAMIAAWWTEDDDEGGEL
jgi:hypothetical protein